MGVGSFFILLEKISFYSNLILISYFRV